MVTFHRFTTGALRVGAIALTVSGCLKGPGFFKQDATQRNDTRTKEQVVVVQTREDNGAIIGALDPNAAGVQLIQGPSDGDIAGTEVAFPPGSISVSTEISVQQANTLVDSTTLSALELGATLTASAAAVSITSSVSMDTLQPFVVALPLPGAASLADDPYANLVVLYKIGKVAEAGDYYGVFARDQLTVENGKVKFATTYFGVFQAIITQSLVAAAVEKPVEQVVAKPVQKLRRYYARGFQSVTFGDDAASVSDFKGWIARLAPMAVIKGASKLSTDMISYEKREGAP